MAYDPKLDDDLNNLEDDVIIVDEGQKGGESKQNKQADSENADTLGDLPADEY